ncbi:hypothetical protein [Tenacibaculum finnmarkense]|uniref:hypothetical protein n=1 Tax=Tenacibaculum finnmarkense TaxID=2781243 RepID=UPI00187B180C|nr:hypothetical protein [Tenacibaculum finnmarkense]MBE7649325.1 hypothetical protein [Tenacibaculum finnmarkense genomovar ulcerans]MCD8401296.1 hypothetical protein [Tenacibaculum finnmarkense genomovar ulcerans]MCD8423632.1 hypothetical protein [Tenacibaculum finnmarkense genomovar ulcerans]MCD8433600.1 hypothetical protein [Tenacibaculum finnmarkense genomovar ulcerans]MCG8239765.1 hypothetical protein [Tenacibaculum finnmarkense genomovar ulcerans]
MNELTFEINSNKEIWELFDKKANSIFIHKFVPNEVIKWWKTDLKTENGTEFKNLSVRQMKMDVQTDLNGLKKILELNTRQLRIYQFDKPISDTLEIERLPEKNRNQILKQNGLKHFFFVDFEFITVGSFESEFINEIESHPIFEKRISERKRTIMEQKTGHNKV